MAKRKAGWVCMAGMLAVGPPEVIAACEESFTGRFLKPLLAQG